VNQITFANTALMAGSARRSGYVSKFTHETGHDQSEITGHDISEMTGHAPETPGHVGLKYAPLPANLAEDTFKSAKNSKKMLFIDETCQPYKYTPKYKIPPIEINKPRNAGPNPTANTAFSVQDVVNTSAPITTTDTTPGLPQADNTTNPQIPLIKKTKPKPLPKPSQRANNQQSKTEALGKPPSTTDAKRGKQLTSGEGITLPELPDDD